MSVRRSSWSFVKKTVPGLLKLSKPKAKPATSNTAWNADEALWEILGTSSVRGVRFERRRRVGATFVEFYCEPARLAVEVERPITNEMRKKEEVLRSRQLRSIGVQILRFPEEVIRNRPASVRNTIREELPAVKTR
jgi:very-short-patch-repair endonuclease